MEVVMDNTNWTPEELEEYRRKAQELKNSLGSKEGQVAVPVQTEQPVQQPVANTENQNFHRDMKLDMNPFKWAYMSGMGALDVPFDVIGAVPGLGGIDDTWDRITRFDNPGAAKFREVSSVIIPAIIFGSKYQKFHAARNLTGLNGAIQNVGGQALINAAIGGISDYGENPENRLITHPDNFRRLAEAWPEYFGPDGHFPSIEALADADATHPMMNRFMSAVDEGLLQGFGDLFGYALNAGKPILRSMIPVTPKSKWFKFNTQLQNIERDTRNRIIDIDNLIASETLSKEQIEALGAEKSKLIQQATQTGRSDVTQNAGESFIKDRQRQRDQFRKSRALSKLANDTDPTKFDPDITPKLASQKELAGIPNTTPGAAVENAITVDGKLTGYFDELGVPPDPITVPMYNGMLMGKGIRKAVRFIADKVRDADGYKYVVAGFRGTSKQANANAYEIYNKWMKAGTGDELRKLMSDPSYRDDKTLISELIEGSKVTYLNDAGAAKAAALMINDLVNLYIGREITESSARVMDTLGAQVAAKSGAPQQFKNLLDDERVFKNVLDKLEVLYQEYGLSKYIAGWQLNQKRWWKNLDEIANPIERMDISFKEFGAKSEQLATDWKAFRQQLDAAAEKDPRLARSLMQAYEATDGNVDTLMKLNEYARYHLSPAGLFWNKERKDLGITGWKMNQFAKGAWAVTYNSVLSGLATLRAAVGNGMMLIFKPLAAIQHAGFNQLIGKDKDAIRRVTLMYGTMHETARRAWGDALTRMKKVHQDPDFMMKAARKDFVVEDSNTWEVLDGLKEVWKEEGNHVNNFLYGWANMQRKIARAPWLRTGITGMSGIDAFTDTFMATYQSRVKAYDDVLKMGKNTDPEAFKQAFKKAEELNYSTMFDQQGLLKDKAAKHASGEIALNLDEGVSKILNPVLNKFPVMKTLMMFPRTSMNQINLGLSYTPLTLIPGLGKMGDVLLAGDDLVKIKAVMTKHGINNWDETPNAMAMFKDLKREYESRLMMGGTTAVLAWGYAMAGGIRGNGPTNHRDLTRLRKQGWKPNTIKIGNNWVSFKGMPVVEQYFNLMGDMAYYSTALGSNMIASNIDKTMWTLTATYLMGTPLQGMEPLHMAMRGDEGAFKRLFAQQLRSAIPLSGAQSMIGKAITNAQKEIYNDFWGYLRNSTVARDLSYSKIDHWTGDEIDEIDNPFLRMLNAMNPVKVHGGNEPWRQWLIETGFDDYNEIKQNQDGYKYSPAEREIIGKLMGKMNLSKRIEKEFMNNKVYNQDLKNLREFANPAKSEREVAEYRNELTLYKNLKNLIREARDAAETQMINDPQYKHISELSMGRRKTQSHMRNNEIEAAADQSRKNYKLQKSIKR